LLKNWIAPVLTLGVLGVGAAQPMLHGRPGDVDAYLERVQGAAKMPMEIGEWVGKDHELPQAAVKMLKPNAAISRSYTNKKTGEVVEFLMVDCSDGRDLAGHYPPNCYPGAGWTKVGEQAKTWKVGEMEIPGVEYEFVMHGAVQQGHLFAADFFVMPDGNFLPDMARFNRASADYRKHYYGAAQVEVTCGGETLPQDRDARFAMLVGACEPMLDVIRSGCKP
jgi:hypothetical protein